MKQITYLFGVLVLAFFPINNSSAQNSIPVKKGLYLGQEPPGDVPQVFAPGIVSTGFFEHSFPTFSPDGKEVHWSVVFPLGLRGGLERGFPTTILCMKEEDGKWLPPQFTEFKTLFEEAEGFFSPDGNNYFFYSNRPIPDGGHSENNGNIWVREKKGTGWGEPVPISSNINTENHEYSPTVTYNGTLYYKGFWEGGQYNIGIYRSELQNGEYSNPELLLESINSPHLDWTPYISSDESYLLFSSERPGGYGEGDIYIAFRKNDGTWTEAINLGKSINSEDDERYPYVSPDGKYLFFNSDKFLFENVKRNNYTYNQLTIGISFLCLRQISHNFPQFPATDVLE